MLHVYIMVVSDSFCNIFFVYLCDTQISLLGTILSSMGLLNTVKLNWE